LLLLLINADQQREATADLNLAVDFLRQEYADQLGANYSELNSVPLMLARLRRTRHRQADPEHPEVSSPDPLGASPAASSFESTPLRRHWRRRRLRRSGIQQPDDVAINSVAPAVILDSSGVEKATPIESVAYDDRELTTEVASAAINHQGNEKSEDFSVELGDQRAQYAERLLEIAHGLHIGSIAILGVFVIQV